MSRKSDIDALRAWIKQQSTNLDPSMSALVLRVCDHAEVAMIETARDWEAVRIQAAIAIYTSARPGMPRTEDNVIRVADHLVNEMKKAAK